MCYSLIFCYYFPSGYSLECDAGYICMTGSSVPNPTDNVVGYVCPMGYYCPQGAVIEIPCAPGDYSPSTGLGKVHSFFSCTLMTLLYYSRNWYLSRFLYQKLLEIMFLLYIQNRPISGSNTEDPVQKLWK